MKNILKISLVTLVSLVPVTSYASESRCAAIGQVPETISNVLELIKDLPNKEAQTAQSEISNLEKEVAALADPTNGVSNCNEYSDEMLKQAFTALQDVKQGFSTEHGPELHQEVALNR